MQQGVKKSSNTQESLRLALQRFISDTIDVNNMYARVGQVTSFDESTSSCSVKFPEDSTEITDVQLQRVPNASGWLVRPSIDSFVLIDWINETSAYIALTSQIDDIVFQGGDNGGLIKIEDLTSKLNELVSSVNAMYGEFKAHTHNVTAVGSPTGPVIPVPAQPDASDFNKSDYENENFKH